MSRNTINLIFLENKHSHKYLMKYFLSILKLYLLILFVLICDMNGIGLTILWYFRTTRYVSCPLSSPVSQQDVVFCCAFNLRICP